LIKRFNNSGNGIRHLGIRKNSSSRFKGKGHREKPPTILSNWTQVKATVRLSREKGEGRGERGEGSRERVNDSFTSLRIDNRIYV
jgi:hypothetical protein